MSPRRVDPDAIPRSVHKLCRRLADAGYRAWVVGGCIRDLLLGREVNDWDLATSARPEQVRDLFRRTIPTGIEHGTVTVMIGKEAFEVTTLRGEGGYSDGRRPDHVEFVTSIEEDLERRDFTVNAIAYDPLENELVDPWGGLDDLDRRLIRAVRDPALRFGEDGLRVLRAARFCATLGFDLDPATEAAIPGSLRTYRRVSAERVLQEWTKALKSPRPSPAFEVMQRTGILAITCPPLSERPDFTRTLARTDACPPVPALRLGALLYGLDDSWADRWLRQLRVSNEVRKRAVGVVKHAALPPSDIDGEALRRWVARVGRSVMPDLLEVARADERCGGPILPPLPQRAVAVLESGLPLTPAELPLDGGTLMAELGLEPGPQVGEILRWLVERVLEDPSRNDEAALRALLPAARDAIRSEA